MSGSLRVSVEEAKEKYGVELPDFVNPYYTVTGLEQNLSQNNIKQVLEAYEKHCKAFQAAVNAPVYIWQYNLTEEENFRRSQMGPIAELEKSHQAALKTFDSALKNTGLKLLNSRNVSLGPPE